MTTSLPVLFDDLLKDKIYACGTYNRTSKCYPKCLNAMPMLSLVSRSEESTSTDSEVAYLYHCGKTQRQVVVPCPLAIGIYNEFMAGVDNNDQLRGYYSVRIKSRKTYKCLFLFLFDIAIVNSLMLYRLSPVVRRMKEFRVQFPMQIIGSYNSRNTRDAHAYRNEQSQTRRMNPITPPKHREEGADFARSDFLVV